MVTIDLSLPAVIGIGAATIMLCAWLAQPIVSGYVNIYDTHLDADVNRKKLMQNTMSLQAQSLEPIRTEELTYLLNSPQNHSLAMLALVHIVGEVKRANPKVSVTGLIGYCFGYSSGPDFKRRQAFIIAILQEAAKKKERKELAA